MYIHIYIPPWEREWLTNIAITVSNIVTGLRSLKLVIRYPLESRLTAYQSYFYADSKISSPEYLWEGHNTHLSTLNTFSTVFWQGYFSIRVIVALESSQSRGYRITSVNDLKFVTRFPTVIVSFQPSNGCTVIFKANQNQIPLYGYRIHILCNSFT